MREFLVLIACLAFIVGVVVVVVDLGFQQNELGCKETARIMDVEWRYERPSFFIGGCFIMWNDKWIPSSALRIID